MKRYIILSLLSGIIGAIIPQPISAKTDSIPQKKDWEFDLHAGVNLGGIAPIPFPKEIREIIKFDPKLNGFIGATATRWYSSQWGLLVGFTFEQKSMESVARVKNYQMAITEAGEPLEGVYTGTVRNSYSASLLTFPIAAVYSYTDKLKFNGGVYVGLRFYGDFSGDVYSGYFRKGGPTGEKVVFNEETKTPYSFKENLSPWEIGAQLGCSYQVYRNFSITGNFKYGINSIFQKDFKTISVHMSPIYFALGFSYLF